MNKFLKWTLGSIRKDGSMMSWMEEKRFEWVPLAASILENILEGRTIILITDEPRDWFSDYVLKTINATHKNRPFLPVISMKTFFPNVNQIKTNQDIELLENMLSQSFVNGYTFFYVGKSNDIKMQLAKRCNNSFMWVFDEHIQNSFYLSSADEMLDIKLIQLFLLLDRSIDAVLFAEVSLEADE